MDLETFLLDLTNRAVPGGAAAAAQSAAMGAALLRKVARVALQRPTIAASAQGHFETLWAIASEQQAALTELADEDTQAYRELLALQRSPADDALVKQTWSRVIDIPIRLAGACDRLLQASSSIDEICPTRLLPDLWIAQSLLTAGVKAGVWCAEANLRTSPSILDTASFRLRLAALADSPFGSPPK